ncbi:hypothetical protein KIH41_17455 [Litoribacter ruber]|uniref:PepSY domain-containing protein n=1 Tax=Litoribacter ruber TaxID=702568 RepID=A0AAP2CPC7_9BACT|nr:MULTISPECIES: hypothetical protein [Litoribacter]MBS9525447.1 hypothetical protein [Litoribacter alkaliphilus]MBT0813079.1 hypothetical protein [Litoribacter ruber]
MKKLLYLAGIPIALMMGACDNSPNTGDRTNDADGRAVLEDTSRRTDVDHNRTNLDREPNRGGETTPGTHREMDRQDVDRANVPQNIQSRVDNDANLQNREMTRTQRYTRDGITYYEMTFRDQGGQESTVTYDQDGNRTDQ